MPRKQYAEATAYERKLERVMERFDATDPNWNYDRHGAWVEFRYRGQLYRFDHSVESAKAAGQTLSFGSDCFAQIVLALEDLARIRERGIYDLQTWLAGMKYLPPPIAIPECFRLLGFETMPGRREDVEKRYRSLAKQYHPDAGGNTEDWLILERAVEQAMRHLGQAVN